ncbi:hypothetical protein BBJ28_00004659 [Nothophytophthora sp. Chile5]|nr:hypothetical protein BBJ28_00004659 [Nothophytophthora sp. Chile5]
MEPALLALQELCERSRELQPLCEPLLGRVVALCGYTDQLRASPSGESKRQWVTQVDAVLARFSRLLEHQAATDNAVFRLAVAPTPVRELHALHAALDAVFRDLHAEHVDPNAQWLTDWDHALEHMEQTLQLAARVHVDADEGGTASEQCEALAVVQCAFQQAQDAAKRRQDAAKRRRSHSSGGTPPRANSDAEEELELLPDHEEWLRVLFRKLVRVSSAQVPRLPPWFLSPAQVALHPALFRGGPSCEIVRGDWMRSDGDSMQILVKRSALGSSVEAEAFVQHEAALLHAVPQHPHVLQLVGACAFGLQPFVAFESPWTAPETVVVSLEDYLTLSVDHRRQVFRLLAQAASGLQSLHSASLAHGDLRCSNVLVGADGHAKLANLRCFSLTRCVSSSESEQLTRFQYEAAGSLRWQAPELLAKEGVAAPAIDLASDIYALGMTILEALSGELPWGFQSDEEVRERVLHGELPTPPAGLDESVWSLLEAMCDADRAARPDINTVVEELQALADEERERDGGSNSLEESVPPLPLPRLSSAIADLMKPTTAASDDGSRRRSGTTGSSTTVRLQRPFSETSEVATAVVELRQKWLGVKINAIGNRVVVSKFLRSESGAAGEIEASGHVARGDVIVAVNGQSVRGLDRLQIGAFVQSTPRPLQLTFERDPQLLTDSFRFRGLRMDPRWRDRGSALPLPGSLAHLLTPNSSDVFSLELWFSLAELGDTVLGGILLGAQDLPFQETSDASGWPYIHQQLLNVDPMGNLWCCFLNRSAPICVARELLPNHWYHLVVAYGGATAADRETFSSTSRVSDQSEQVLTVYLDGEQRFAGSGGLLADWSRLRHVNVGSGCISGLTPGKPEPQFSGWFGFSGLVFDLRVWQRLELSELQVQLLFRGSGDFVAAPGYSLRRDLLGEAAETTQSARTISGDSSDGRRRRASSTPARSSRLQGPPFAELVQSTWPHQVGAQVYS